MAQERYKIKIGIDLNEAQSIKEVRQLVKKLQAKIDSNELKMDVKLDKEELYKFNKTLKDTKKKTKESRHELNKLESQAKKTGKSGKKAMDDVSSSTGKAKAQSKGLGQSMGSAITKFAQWAGIGALIYGVVNALRDAFRVTLEVETAMTNFKIVTGATSEELNTVNESVNKLVSNLGALKSEAIDATTEFARAGFSVQESMELAEQSIIGANVGFTNLDSVSRNLIATLKAYNLTAVDSKNVINDLFVASNESAVTFEGLGEAIRRSGNSLREAGASYEQSLGLIASANESVQDPAKVGSALKTISARLRGVDEANNLPVLKDQLNAIGVEIESASGGFRNVYDVLGDVSRAFEKSNDEFQKQAILENLAGKRRANILAGLLNNYETAQKVFDETSQSVNDAQKAQQEVLETGAGQIKKMKGNWEVFASAVIENNAVVSSLETINSWINRINSNLVGRNYAEDYINRLEESNDIILSGAQDLEDRISEVMQKEHLGEFAKAYEETSKIINKGNKEELEQLKETVWQYKQKKQSLEQQIMTHQAMAHEVGRSSVEITKSQRKTRELLEEIIDLDEAARLDGIKDYDSTLENIYKRLDKMVEANEEATNSITNTQKKTNNLAKTSTDTFKKYSENFEFLTDSRKQAMEDMLNTDIQNTKDQIYNARLRIQSYEAEESAHNKMINNIIDDMEKASGIDALRLEHRAIKLKEYISEDYEEEQEDLDKLLSDLDNLETTYDKFFASGSDTDADGGGDVSKPMNEFAYAIEEAQARLNEIKANTESTAQDQINAINQVTKAQRKYRTELEKQREEIKKTQGETSKAYQDISLQISDLTTNIYSNAGAIDKLNQTITENIKENREKVYQQMKQNAKDDFENLKNQYENDFEEFEKYQQKKIDAVKESLNELQKEREKDEFKDEEKKLLDEISKLEKEYDQRSLSNSLQSRNKRYQLSNDIAEKEMDLAELREDRKYDLEEEALEDKISLLEKELDEEKEAYEEKVEELEDYLDDAQDAIDDSEQEWLNSGMTIGEALNEGLMSGLQESLNAIEEITGVDMSDKISSGGGTSTGGGTTGSTGGATGGTGGGSSDYDPNEVIENLDDPEGMSRSEISDKYEDKYGTPPDSGVIDDIKESGGLFHDGGVVGNMSFKDTSMFDYMGDLGANEVPVIVEQGETILTREQTEDVSNSMNGGYNSLLTVQNLNVKASDSYDAQNIGEDLVKGARREELKSGRG